MAPSPSVLRKALIPIANARPAIGLKGKAMARAAEAVDATKTKIIKNAMPTETG